MLNRRAVVLFAFLTSAALAGEEILIADFEGETYALWTVTGEAFGRGVGEEAASGTEACRWFLR